MPLLSLRTIARIIAGFAAVLPSFAQEEEKIPESPAKSRKEKLRATAQAIKTSGKCGAKDEDSNSVITSVSGLQQDCTCQWLECMQRKPSTDM